MLLLLYLGQFANGVAKFEIVCCNLCHTSLRPRQLGSSLDKAPRLSIRAILGKSPNRSDTLPKDPNKSDRLPDLKSMQIQRLRYI